MSLLWRRILGTIWAIIFLPFGWVVLAGAGVGIADGVRLDLGSFIVLFAPLILLIGAIAGWLPKSTTAWSQVLVILPFIPLIFLGVTIFLGIF